MTKMIKLSLVAAVAVAGFTTTASAAPTVAGSIAYQFQKKDSANEVYQENTKAVLKFTGAINDKLSYGVVTAAKSASEEGYSAAPAFGLVNAKFTYKTDAATVIMGKQGITTAWTNGASTIDGIQTGNGVIAMIPMGGATLVAANIVNHNIANALMTNDSDISILALLGKAGDVKYQLWGASIAEDEAATVEGLTAVTAAVDAKLGAINLGVRYSTVDSDGLADAQSLLSVKASVKAGDAKITLVAAKAGEDGDLVSLDGSGNAANTIYGGWNVSMGLGGNADATMLALQASMPVTDSVTGTVKVSTKTGDYNNDMQEIFAQASFSIAKNMTLYARAANVTYDTNANEDFVRTRLFAAYKF